MGIYWLLSALAGFDCRKAILIGFDWLLSAFARFDWCKVISVGFGWLWLALVGFGWLWLALVRNTGQPCRTSHSVVAIPHIGIYTYFRKMQAARFGQWPG
jgi:hypothetical protein